MEGVFERGSKKAQKNIEVDVTIFNSDGNMIEVSIFITCCKFSYYTFLNGLPNNSYKPITNMAWVCG